MDTAESHTTPGAQPEPPPEQADDGRRRIGEIFVELGFITAPQLEAALEVQREKGGRIGEILVAQGSLTRLDLASALTEHWEPHRFALPKAGRGAGGADTRRIAEQDHAAIAGLEQRLRAAEDRLGSVEGSADPDGSFEVQKGAVAELEERLARVEQLVGSHAELDLRLATLEEALDQQLSSRLDDLARRLDAQDAAHEEHVPATEQALLEGLSTLRAAIEGLEAQSREKDRRKQDKKPERDDPAPPESD